MFQILLKSIQLSWSGTHLKFTIEMIEKRKIYAVFRLSISEFWSLGSENSIEWVSYGLLRVCQRTSKNIQDPLRYSVFKVPKIDFSRPKNDQKLGLGLALGLRLGLALGLRLGLALGIRLGLGLALGIGLRLGLALGLRLGLALGLRLGLG